jgi:hypothetical protein
VPSRSPQADPASVSFTSPVLADGVLDVSLAHHLDYQEMDAFSYGYTNPLRNAANTIRILAKDRREYVVGIALLLVVVFLWVLSNFITQVHANHFSFSAQLIVPLCVGYFSRRIRETLPVCSSRDPAMAT